MGREVLPGEGRFPDAETSPFSPINFLIASDSYMFSS